MGRVVMSERELKRIEILAQIEGGRLSVVVIAGWVTTEVGRQPFTVYGLMRTAESASPLAAPAVTASLVAFVIVYLCVFGAGIYHVLKLMAATPKAGEDLPANLPQRAAGITPAAAMSGDAGKGV